MLRGVAGVYRYGSSGFPSSTWNGSAYFVDALLRPTTSPSPSASTTASPSSTPAPPSVTPSATPSTTATPTSRPTVSASPTNASPTATPSGTPTPTTTAIPSECARNGTYVWSNLETCGWPGPTSTGYQASACPSGLTTNAGSLTRTIRITAAGTSISCQDITGCLSIEAPNVTVSNVKIACSSGRSGEAANGTAVISIDNGASATVDHVDVDGRSGVHACIWHQGTRLTAQGIDCSEVNDGIFSWADTGYSQTTGDNFSIRDSYFHDFTARTANGHIDGYQTEGAANGLIEHNTFLMTSDDGNSTDSAHRDLERYPE